MISEQAKGRYKVTGETYDKFLETFADRHPLHVDDSYARSKGFEKRVMHGAILNGFLSHFIGMIHPAAHSVILAVEMQYLTPCYLEDELEITAETLQFAESVATVILRVKFNNLTQGRTAAAAKVTVQLKKPT